MRAAIENLRSRDASWRVSAQPAVTGLGNTPRLLKYWLCCCLAVVWAGKGVVPLSAAEISYNQDVRPILAEHCFQCHGPDATNRGADLRLDEPSAAYASAINRAEPAASELLRRIDATDDEIMPPRDTDKPLTAAQRETLRAWILAGAHYQGHWAFEPLREVAPPQAASLSTDTSPSPNAQAGTNTPAGPNAQQGPHAPASPDAQQGQEAESSQRVTTTSSGSAVDPIDGFLLSKLTARGLSYSPSLNRRELIRRVTFDLIGLPPTWEEVAAFEQDSGADAYEKLIDRLLDSPRYGERWGRHWLDLARYADTHGGAAIGFQSFPFSYTYRDYVIRAFNEDKPYPRFVLEQIAADQLDLPSDAPQLAALGFLTVGMQFRNYHDTIDDQIDVVTRGLMGLTVACARCHDHKFDPIPTHDYYAIYATLAPSAQPEQLPVIGEAADREARQKYNEQLAELQGRYEDFARDQNEVMRSRLRMQVGLYLREIAKGATEQDVSTEFLSYRTDDVRPIILNRWLSYLAARTPRDPVWGPWIQLQAERELPADAFRARVTQLLEQMTSDLEKSGWTAEKQHQLSGDPPVWNPRLVAALKEQPPGSILELADLYGKLFGEVHQEWLAGCQRASLEAVSESSVIPDDSPEHESINSPVHRQLRRHLYAADSPTVVTESIARTLTNRTINDMISAKMGAVHELNLTAAGSPPRAMLLTEPHEPPSYFVFQRGNPLSRGEPVQPGFLSVLPVSLEQPQPGRRRLALAQAITSSSNPLTPRVLVNWVWQHHFGQGLVTTPDDFGTRGVPPVHPELLDYLAKKFIADGWSIKQLHRTILLSQAYQQSSIENDLARTADPDNSLYWRMPRRRLEFESMRDAMLHVSGELDLTMSGRPIDLTATPAIPRRSVYGFVNRDIVSPLMSTFDAANPNSCTAKRPETTVPQQTLFALNSDFIQDRAAKLQEWVSSLDKTEPSQQVIALYQRTLSRTPSDSEISRAIAFLHAATQPAAVSAEAGATGPAVASNTSEAGAATAGGAPPAADPAATAAAELAARWRQLAHALLASNEFVFLD